MAGAYCDGWAGVSGETPVAVMVPMRRFTKGLGDCFPASILSGSAHSAAVGMCSAHLRVPFWCVRTDRWSECWAIPERSRRLQVTRKSPGWWEEIKATLEVCISHFEGYPPPVSHSLSSAEFPTHSSCPSMITTRVQARQPIRRPIRPIQPPAKAVAF